MANEFKVKNGIVIDNTQPISGIYNVITGSNPNRLISESGIVTYATSLVSSKNLSGVLLAGNDAGNQQITNLSGINYVTNNIQMNDVNNMGITTSGVLTIRAAQPIQMRTSNGISMANSSGIAYALFDSTGASLPLLTIPNITSASNRSMVTREYVNQFKSSGILGMIQASNGTGGFTTVGLKATHNVGNFINEIADDNYTIFGGSTNNKSVRLTGNKVYLGVDATFEPQIEVTKDTSGHTIKALNYSNAQIDLAGNTSLITKEYLDNSISGVIFSSNLSGVLTAGNNAFGQDIQNVGTLDVDNQIKLGNPGLIEGKLEIYMPAASPGSGLLVTGTETGTGPNGTGNADGTYTYLGTTIGQMTNVYRRGSANVWIGQVSSIWIITNNVSPGNWTDGKYYLNSLEPIGIYSPIAGQGTTANPTVSQGGSLVGSTAIHTNGDIIADGTASVGTLTVKDKLGISYNTILSGSVFDINSVGTFPYTFRQQASDLLTLNTDGSASLPNCDITDITYDNDIIIKSYGDTYYDKGRYTLSLDSALNTLTLMSIDKGTVHNLIATDPIITITLDSTVAIESWFDFILPTDITKQITIICGTQTTNYIAINGIFRIYKYANNDARLMEYTQTGKTSAGGNGYIQASDGLGGFKIVGIKTNHSVGNYINETVEDNYTIFGGAANTKTVRLTGNKMYLGVDATFEPQIEVTKDTSGHSIKALNYSNAQIDLAGSGSLVTAGWVKSQPNYGFASVDTYDEWLAAMTDVDVTFINMNKPIYVTPSTPLTVIIRCNKILTGCTIYFTGTALTTFTSGNSALKYSVTMTNNQIDLASNLYDVYVGGGATNFLALNNISVFAKRVGLTSSNFFVSSVGTEAMGFNYESINISPNFNASSVMYRTWFDNTSKSEIVYGAKTGTASISVANQLVFNTGQEMTTGNISKLAGIGDLFSDSIIIHGLTILKVYNRSGSNGIVPAGTHVYADATAASYGKVISLVAGGTTTPSATSPYLGMVMEDISINNNAFDNVKILFKPEPFSSVAGSFTISNTTELLAALANTTYTDKTIICSNKSATLLGYIDLPASSIYGANYIYGMQNINVTGNMTKAPTSPTNGVVFFHTPFVTLNTGTLTLTDVKLYIRAVTIVAASIIINKVGIGEIEYERKSGSFTITGTATLTQNFWDNTNTSSGGTVGQLSGQAFNYFKNGAVGSNVVLTATGGATYIQGYIITSATGAKLKSIRINTGQGSTGQATNVTIRVASYPANNGTQYVVGAGTTIISQNMLVVGAATTSKFYVSEVYTLPTPLDIPANQIIFVEINCLFWTLTDVIVTLTVAD